MLAFFFCASPYVFSQEKATSLKAEKPTSILKREGIDNVKKETEQEESDTNDQEIIIKNTLASKEEVKKTVKRTKEKVQAWKDAGKEWFE